MDAIRAEKNGEEGVRIRIRMHSTSTRSLGFANSRCKESERGYRKGYNVSRLYASQPSLPALTTMQWTDGNLPRTESLPKRSTFGALFSRTLPAYSGRYPVGVRDVELPIPPQTFGSFKHRSMSDGQVGIILDTIMFTLFYPTELTTARTAPVIWFPR